MVVAAVLLLIQGVLGIAYPVLMTAPDGVWALTLLIVGFGVVNVAAGIGLLRMDGWARVLAAGLAGGALLLLRAPALGAMLTGGGPVGDDWFDLASYLAVLWRSCSAGRQRGDQASADAGGSPRSATSCRYALRAAVTVG